MRPLLNLDHIAASLIRAPLARARANPLSAGRKLDKTSGREFQIPTSRQSRYHTARDLFCCRVFSRGSHFSSQQRRPTCQRRKTLFCTSKRRKIEK